MTLKVFSGLPRGFATALMIGTFAVVTACAKPDPALTRGEPYDPWEAENRRMHAFNRSVDRGVVRPAGKGYTRIIPDDIETLVSRFAENLSLPGSVVNSVLQGNMRGAGTDTFRFLVNSTVGLGGFFDPASELNMPEKTDADFGQTLYVWGANEGPYIELPLLGASTTRDAVGKTVDIVTNPLTYVLPSPERLYGTVASVSSGLSARGQYSETIDSILYESADSYAATRSIYLQNRRFKLGSTSQGKYDDPYDDALGSAPGDDIYDDPYKE